MNIGARILILLNEQGISRREFARRLHVNYSTVNGYILNRRLPSCEMLLHISEILNSSSDYLLGRTSQKFSKDLNYSPKESLLISHFRSLDPDKQEILIRISQSLETKKISPEFPIWKK